MRYFPIFIELTSDRTALVYGGGEDASRKVRLLARTEAAIRVVAPDLHPELQQLSASGRIEWLNETFSPAQLVAAVSIIIAEDNDIAADISQAAQQRHIPVNVIDNPGLSTFIVPAIVDRDPLVIAIGTEGAGPVLAQGIRARIEAMIPPQTGKLLEHARALRNKAAQLVPSGSARRRFWQQFFFGRIRDAFLSGNEASYQREITRSLASHGSTMGRIALIAVPDDPELLTLKAHRLLQEADVIVHDSEVSSGIFNYTRRDAVHQPSGINQWTSCQATHTALAQRIATLATSGNKVIRLVDAIGCTAESELHQLKGETPAGITIDYLPSSEPCPNHWAPVFGRDYAKTQPSHLRIAS